MSLPLSAKLTNIVNASYDSGELFELVTPTTAELLRFWFDEAYCETRRINFHSGQKQAILNTIYCHEVLKSESVEDMYAKVDSALSLEENIIEEILETKRYSFPRYCMKMATGTWKTFVLHALLIRQYLNAHAEHEWFSKNFLIIAPWLIVYERLLDAFLGKSLETWGRDISSSDYAKYQELFLPAHHKESIINFVQSHVVAKEEIWRKITGDGQIIITNRQALMIRDDDEEEEEDGEESADYESNYDPYEEPQKLLRDLIPTRPWKSAGNSLDTLDRTYLKGSSLEYCKRLSSLIVFNDEAHHLGTTDDDKKRQQSINYISESKKTFTQIDFSATPYVQKWAKKIYFPHIITDFPIQEAIRQGLVKMIAIDKRKEVWTIADADLNYMAERDENAKIVWLSEGQKIMIKAGLSKLTLIDTQFSSQIVSETPKHPKMLIVCEDTKVVPFVTEFLREVWYTEDEFIEIHSDKKWNVKPEERDAIKYKVFSIDKHKDPKIVVSVLMLKEWFDVNNICVIVPLRSSTSWILLEQTIGRWLRLMRREYEDIRMENIRNLLNKKREITNYIDVLSIVEHPKYYAYRQELQNEWLLAEDTMTDEEMSKQAAGDLIPVALKENYEEYDMFRPIIISDVWEVFKDPEFSPANLGRMPWGDFAFRKSKVGDKETFRSEAVISWTKFGDYNVDYGIMQAQNYNDYLTKLVRRITHHTNREKEDQKLNKKWFWTLWSGYYPTLQINLAYLAKVTDEYLTHYLFGESVAYMEDNNRRVLMLDVVANHIIAQMVQLIITYQDDATYQVGEAVVQQRRISELWTISLRESFCVPVHKSVYPLLAYPSNKWLTEKDFMLFADNDGQVERFCKIYEHKHTFLRLRYIREDGIPAFYHPDFIVQTADTIYLVEIKAEKDLWNANVLRKKKSAVHYLNRINDLPAHLRDNRIWSYVLLGDTQFYMMKEAHASLIDILERTKLYSIGTTLF